MQAQKWVVLGWLVGMLPLGWAQAADLPACPTEITAGQVMQVGLKTQAGTGYSWVLRSHSDNLRFLTQGEFEPYEGPEVGKSVLQNWQWEAMQTGVADITLDYLRPWQPDDVAQTWQCVFPIVAKQRI